MARSHPENAHLHGKYHCTDDLLFILFGFSCFAYVEGTTCLVKIQTSQAGGQPYSDTSHYGEFSMLPTIAKVQETSIFKLILF